MLFDVRDGVGRIRLNRPDAYNAINLTMARELAEIALLIAGERSVRCLILSGEGKAFCGGGDLKEFAAQGDNMAAHLTEVTTHLHTAISRLVHLDAPVIAAVQGSAAGAGMSMACACDLVIAARSSRFTMAYTRVGLTPDGSSTFFLPRLVGLRRALDLVLTNRVLDAQQAQKWGVVSEVVDDSALEEHVGLLTRTLAAGPTHALGEAKRLMRDSWTHTLESQMAEETRTIASLAHGNDGHEGIAAFIDKRRPNFTGT